MKIPKPIAEQFLEFVDSNIDAAKQARKSVRELDELFTAGFKGAEVELVAALIEELDRDGDEYRRSSRPSSGPRCLRSRRRWIRSTRCSSTRSFEITGEIADMAERVGRRLELLLS